MTAECGPCRAVQMVRRVQSGYHDGGSHEHQYADNQHTQESQYYAYYQEQAATPHQPGHSHVSYAPEAPSGGSAYAQPYQNVQVPPVTGGYSVDYNTGQHATSVNTGHHSTGHATDAGTSHHTANYANYANYADYGAPQSQTGGAYPTPPLSTQSAARPAGPYAYGSQPAKSWISAFGTGGFADEPPLLEELGINFGHIKAKTIASINPFRRLDAATLADADLTGPLLFCFLFGLSLLLSGKIHFGYIYGVAALGWLSVYAILHLMTEAGVSFYLTASVLGYCLLPMVFLSAIAVLLRLRGMMGMILGVASVSWCTLSSSTIFVSAFRMKDQQILIAYPIFLLYSCFALMTIF